MTAYSEYEWGDGAIHHHNAQHATKQDLTGGEESVLQDDLSRIVKLHQLPHTGGCIHKVSVSADSTLVFVERGSRPIRVAGAPHDALKALVCPTATVAEQGGDGDTAETEEKPTPKAKPRSRSRAKKNASDTEGTDS